MIIKYILRYHPPQETTRESITLVFIYEHPHNTRTLYTTRMTQRPREFRRSRNGSGLRDELHRRRRRRDRRVYNFLLPQSHRS